MHSPITWTTTRASSPLLPQALVSAYRDAALEAVAETGLAGATFPAACPWTVDEVSDAGFLPG
ncbi:MAG TPA: DUF29 family protein [Roseiarcus sp.]|nr:DUF29 family protein [Roseiarcus sp.]